ncbi:hypothetical protein SPLC1_S270310 [Arthrospira platensis C1]|nr:hypothetical protein SPLC1_S270310 [Arthrospira platensis C1]
MGFTQQQLCRLGETQQKVRDGVFGLGHPTEFSAWVATPS